MTMAGPYNDPNYVTRQQLVLPQINGIGTATLASFPISNMRIRAAQVVVALAGTALSTGKLYAGTTSIGQWAGAGTASVLGSQFAVADMNATIAAGTALCVALTGDATGKYNVVLEVHLDPQAVFSGPP